MREFEGFGSFARHLVAVAGIGELVASHVTKEAAKIVRDDAQVRIGMYQEAAGPFPAWAPLADSTIADRIAKGYTPFDPLLRDGTLRDSIEIKSSGGEAVVGSASDIALYQEQGTKTIPPRPFLGPAAYASKHKIGVLSANIMLAWIGGGQWRKPDQLIKLP